MTSNMIWGKTPPPLCDFMQWLDTEQSQQDKDHVERQAKWAAERWQRMLLIYCVNKNNYNIIYL